MNTGTLVASDANDGGMDQRPCSPAGIHASGCASGDVPPVERSDPVPHIYLTHTHMFRPWHRTVESEDSAESVDEDSEDVSDDVTHHSTNRVAARLVLRIACLLVVTGALFALGVLVGGGAWGDAQKSPLPCVGPSNTGNAVSTDDGDWVVAFEESA